MFLPRAAAEASFLCRLDERPKPKSSGAFVFSGEDGSFAGTLGGVLKRGNRFSSVGASLCVVLISCCVAVAFFGILGGLSSGVVSGGGLLAEACTSCHAPPTATDFPVCLAPQCSFPHTWFGPIITQHLCSN